MTHLNINPVQSPPPSNGPWKWVRLIGSRIAAFVLILFALVGAFAALMAAYIAIRTVLWAAERVLDALGVR